MVADIQTVAAAGGEAQLQKFIERAVALEETGDLDGAIGVYEEALMAGFATVEVCYNLAMLYKQQLLFEDAVTLLERCLDSPEYGASAHYASGECLLTLGNLAAAAEHFDQAIARIALDQIPDEQVGEVSHVFRVAIDTFTSLDQRERAGELAERLADFLTRHGDKDQEADKLRAQAARLRDGAPATPPPSPPPAPAAPPPAPPAPVARQSAPAQPAPAQPQPEAPRPAGGPLAAAPPPAPARNPSGRPTTTGRLRTVYRRVTGPLGRPLPAGPRASQPSVLFPQADATAKWDDTTVFEPAGTPRPDSTPRFARRPVEIAPTIPLTDEAAQPAEVRMLLSRSAEDFTQGRFDAVIDDCNQIVALAPDYLPVHLRLAEVYARRGQLGEAIAKCQRLIQLYEAREEPLAALPVHRLIGAISPHDLSLRRKMADLYFAHDTDDSTGLSADVRAMIEEAAAQGNQELALEYAEQLVGHTGYEPESVRLAARLHLRANNPHRALSHFQALLRHDQQDAEAVAGANIGLTLNEGSVHWASLESLVALLQERDEETRRRCLALYEMMIPHVDETSRGNLQVALGLALLGQREAAPAVQALLAAHEAGGADLQPTARFALAYGLKQAYAMLGDGPNERRWLQRAAELLRDARTRQFAERTGLFGMPLSAGALHVALAESFIRDGQADDAIGALEAAKSNLPDDALVRRRLAALYHEHGRLGEALDELDDLSLHQLHAGNLHEMVETLHQMSALAGDNLRVKARLVELYLKRGCPDEALLELERIAAIHSAADRLDEAAEALRQAADTAWMIGQHERAFALYDRVLALAPDNVTLRQAYINCLLQGGRQKDAADQQRAIARKFWEEKRVQETIAALHQVIVLDPRDAASYNLLGEALASVGEYAQAERVYRRLVRLTPDDPIAKAKQTAMAMLAREGRGA